MPRLILILTVALTFILLPGSGHAAVSGWNSTLSAVAATRIDTTRGHRLMLCKVSPVLRVAGLPVWAGQPAYVLAENCHQSERLAPIAANQIEASQSAGLIPSAVPASPRRSMADMLAGVWGWLFLACFGGILILMQRTRRRVARFAALEI